MNDTLLDYLTAAVLALLLTWGLIEHLEYSDGLTPHRSAPATLGQHGATLHRDAKEKAMDAYQTDRIERHGKPTWSNGSMTKTTANRGTSMTATAPSPNGQRGTSDLVSGCWRPMAGTAGMTRSKPPREARREGWNTKPYTFPTKGAQAAAVRADFEYLRRWCEGHWHYCGIRVTLLDDDGEETKVSHELWGIESDCDDYHQTVIAELADECRREVLSNTYAGATVGEAA